MLAEELVQHARGRARVMIGDDADVTGWDFGVRCEMARVLCRLAALHDDADYRAAAVTAPGADYRGDAARVLEAESARALAKGADGAIYALALLELESARP